MKPIKKLFFISIICLCFGTSCERDKYFDLPEDYLSASLYYAVNNGDSFILLQNSSDTILFTITNKNLQYVSPAYQSNYHYEELYFSFDSGALGHLYTSLYFDQNTPKIEVDLPEFPLLGIVEAANYSDTISGVFYSDLYRIKDQFSSSRYIITSRSQGIVYAQNDTVQYVRVY
jgi:hypothetical protein